MKLRAEDNIGTLIGFWREENGLYMSKIISIIITIVIIIITITIIIISSSKRVLFGQIPP
jgi:hypothetical protein